MQMAREIVTNTSESCRKNFQITCYGEHFSLRFRSGAKENQIVVQFCNGNIIVTTEKRSLWESFKTFFQRNKKTIAFVLFGVGTLMTAFGAPVPFLPAVGTCLLVLGGKLASLDDGNDYTNRIYRIT